MKRPLDPVKWYKVNGQVIATGNMLGQLDLVPLLAIVAMGATLAIGLHPFFWSLTAGAGVVLISRLVRLWTSRKERAQEDAERERDRRRKEFMKDLAAIAKIENGPYPAEEKVFLRERYYENVYGQLEAGERVAAIARINSELSSSLPRRSATDGSGEPRGGALSGNTS